MSQALTLPDNTLRAKRIARVRAIVLGCLLGLIALCLYWELIGAPIRPSGSWLALKALPLCIPVAGILRHRLYTFRWVSLLLWLYVLEGLVRATSDIGVSRYYAMAETFLCLVLFIACAVYVRLRLKN
jgi:uncharacterized membrane protein